jgi:hypothetical protein
MTRIASGVTDQYIYFVAVDATDLKTRETGLATWTVYRSRNGGASAAFTTPTINETDSTNMPGVYELLLDEDMTIDAGDETQEMVFHITHAGMAPVTRTIELYRPKITAGNTLDVTATGAAGIDLGNVENPTTSLALTNTTVGTVTNITNNHAKYMLGAVWIGPAVNTNTVSWVDGITTNPVSTVAAAKTIADALGLRKFMIVRSGTVQIGADMTNYDFVGDQWSLTTTGGSRDVSLSSFYNALVVGGTYASTSGAPHWERCEFSTGVSIANGDLHHCLFAGTLTLNSVGDYDFIDCTSIVAGTSAPVFACGSPASALNLSYRRWSGGITITGINSNCTISIDAVSGGTVTLQGVDGTVHVRGMVNLDDQRTGTPTLVQTQRINQANIRAAVGLATANLDTQLSAIDDYVDTEIAALTTELAKVPKSDGTSTWNATALASIQQEATDALNAYDPPTNTEFEARTPTAAQLAYIVANAATGLPVTFTTAGGSTTAAVLNQVDGAAASATNDQYNGRLLVFTDGTLKGVVTDITDYVGSTTTATITAIPTAPTSSHNARLI